MENVHGCLVGAAHIIRMLTKEQQNMFLNTRKLPLRWTSLVDARFRTVK